MACPCHFGVRAGAGKPPEQILYGARLVVHVVDWCDEVGRILWDHDGAEDEPSARLEAVGDPANRSALPASSSAAIAIADGRD